MLAYIFRARALQFSAYTHLGRLLWGAFFTDSNMFMFTSSSPVPRILLCWQMIRPQKRTERRVPPIIIEGGVQGAAGVLSSAG